MGRPWTAATAGVPLNAIHRRNPEFGGSLGRASGQQLTALGDYSEEGVQRVDLFGCGAAPIPNFAAARR